MKIAKEGYRTITNSIVMLIIIGVLINYFSIKQEIYHLTYYVFSLIILTWIVSFFRIPHRQTPIKDTTTNNEQPVYSAADGTVVAIEEVTEKEYFNEKRMQVSVFMSIFNVHANWYPVEGKVIYTKYHPGKHLVARHPKSSLLNEMTTTVLQSSSNKIILVRQIAGLLARRVVCYASLQSEAIPGDRIGFIKLGSRVDIILPIDAKIKVSLNQKVKGSETIIASI